MHFHSIKLSASEQKELVLSLQDNYDEKKMELLIYSMNAFIHKMAKSYEKRMPNASSGMFEDLVSIGQEQIFPCVRLFDASLNVPFFNYAARRIRAYMRSAQKKSLSILQMGDEAFGKIFSKIATVSHLPIDEQAIAIGVSVEDLVNFKLAIKEPKGLTFSADNHSDFSSSDEHDYIDSGEPDPEAINAFKQVMSLSDRFMETMNEREKFIWSEYLTFDDYNQSETARTIGLSRERVRQVTNELEAKFRKILEKHGITPDTIGIIF